MPMPGFIWNDGEAAQGLIVLLVLEPIDLEDRSETVTPSEARSFLKRASYLPRFAKTVYVMCNRRRPTVLKIGQSKNAFDRMRKSAGDRTLGHIRKADRIEHLVLVCLDVPAETVETRLHHLFEAKRVETEHGREWFQVAPSDIINGLKVLAPSPAVTWLPDPATEVWERDQLHSALYGAGEDNAMMLAELGEVNFVSRSEDVLQVQFTIWCPIRHERGDPLPMAVLYPPPSATEEQKEAFADDIRQLEPSCDQELLDVYEIGGRLYPYHDDQRIDRCKEVGFVSSAIHGEPPLTLDEWVVDGRIYEVDFSIRFDILDTFDIRSDGQTILRERAILN